MIDRFANTEQAMKAGQALLEVRKRAILEGWGKEFLTYMLAVNLEMDRLAAEKNGFVAEWTEAFEAGTECARGVWRRNP